MRNLIRWGLENDPHGLAVAVAFPAFITLAAFIGAILCADIPA